MFATISSLAACATTPASVSLSSRRVAEAEAAAREAIANEASLGQVSDNAVAVAPLRASASDTTLGALAFGLAELVALDLAEAKAITVVDRLRLDALLRELKLAESGRVDSATAPRVGRLLGARRIVVGALDTTAQGELGISARVADVSTGVVAGGVEARASVARLFEAQKSLVFKLFDELGVVPTPRERERILQRQTDDLRALLAFSRAVEARVLGDIDLARAGFREAAAIAPRFEAARTSLREVETSAAADGDDALARVTQLNSSAVNPSGSVRVLESADAPFLTLRQAVELLITIRVP